MPNLLLTILTYMQLKNNWQFDQMKDSQTLMNLQQQSADEQTAIMRQQSQEQELVQAELDESEDISTEQYTEAMQKMSEIGNKFDTMLKTLMAANSAKEKQIEQKITAREPKIQAVEADIKNLKETCDKRTEEQFSYFNK